MLHYVVEPIGKTEDGPAHLTRGSECARDLSKPVTVGPINSGDRGEARPRSASDAEESE